MQLQGGWIAQFPGLQRLPDDLQKSLISQSVIVSLPAGSRIYGPGQAPQSYTIPQKF